MKHSYLLASLILLVSCAANAQTGSVLARTGFTAVNQGPTGGCSPLGSANADANTAGFTTIALCNDFTTAIPNNVGTGLPSSWLNCQGDSVDTGAVWNAYAILPCSFYTQVVDAGGGGQLALDMHYDHSYLSQGHEFNNMAFLTTVPPGPGTSNPNGRSWSNGYFEITERTVADTGYFPGEQQAFWAWNQQLYLTTGFVEQDFFEDWATHGQSMDQAWVYWTGNQNGGSFGSNARYPAHTQGNYHTFGTLVTGDNAHFATCNYFDGVRVSCSQQNYTGNQNGGQRRDVRMQSGAQCNTGTYGDISCVGNSFSTVDMYVTNVKALVCAAETTGGTCLGSTYNGSFYQPP